MHDLPVKRHLRTHPPYIVSSAYRVTGSKAGAWSQKGLNDDRVLGSVDACSSIATYVMALHSTIKFEQTPLTHDTARVELIS